MKALVFALLATITASGCGDSSSSKSGSKKLKLEDSSINGAWRSVRTPAKKSGSNHGTSAEGSVSSSSPVLLFIMNGQVNRMSDGGISSKCNLERNFNLEEKRVELLPRLGCDSEVYSIESLSEDEMKIKAVQSADSYYWKDGLTFERLSEEYIQSMLDQFGLVDGSIPEALRNFLQKRYESKSNEDVGKTGLEKVSLFSINSPMYPYTSSVSPSTGDSNSEREYKTYIKLQSGSHVSGGFADDQPYCEVIAKPSAYEIATGALEVTDVWSGKAKTEKGKRFSVVFEFSSRSRTLTRVERMTCFAEKGSETFTINEFNVTVGKYLSHLN